MKLVYQIKKILLNKAKVINLYQVRENSNLINLELLLRKLILYNTIRMNDVY